MRPLIVAGSTHEGEEQILLDVLRRIRQTPGLETTRLLIVPATQSVLRRSHRLAERAGWNVKRRSDPAPGNAAMRTC